MTTTTLRSHEPKRVAQIIRVKPECLEEYKKIHQDVWPGVLAALTRAHVVDYSIFYDPIYSVLFATMKYTGEDYDADMAKVTEDPETRRWWQLTDGMQSSFIEGATGSASGPGWWMPVQEIFRFGG